MSVTDNEIFALQEKQYWPWPLALAYVQQGNGAFVAAVSEVLILYPEQEGFAEFTASSALAKLHEVATGEPCGANDPAFWDDIGKLEADLIAALEAGVISAFGRKEVAGSLEKIDARDWVGSEVSPKRTSDLIVEGWRKTDLLGQALLEVERRVRFYDLHLIGGAVKQLAASFDRDRAAKISDEVHGKSFDEIEELERSGPYLRQGYWSPLVVGAWIASRSADFTAAIQLFEKQRACERGHAHSGTAWWAAGDLMGKRFGMTLTQAQEQLREALEAGKIKGGTGMSGPQNRSRKIARHEWREWDVGHMHGGVFILPDTHSVAWPSEEVLIEFPEQRAAGESLLRGQSVGHSLDEQVRGVLPDNAKPNDVKHEQFAHDAAKLIRTKKIRLSEAIRQVRPSDPMRAAESIDRAIRRAFDLMYDIQGRPIKN